MASSPIDDAIKGYYEKKKDYAALLESALDEKQAHSATDAPKDGATPGRLEREYPIPGFTDAPETPGLKVPTHFPSETDLSRATELIREMRAAVARGKDKELKDMLSKMDRDLGAHCMPKE